MSLSFKLLSVGIVHVGGVLFLSWALKRDTPAPVDMGLVVFVLPTLLAGLAYAYAIHSSVVKTKPSTVSVLTSVALASVPAVIGYAICLFIIVNMYGS